MLSKHLLRNPWIQALACFAILLFAIGFLSWVTGLNGQVCHSIEVGAEPHCQNYNLAYAILLQGFVWIDDASVVIGAMATALLTGITYYLWQLERDSGETTRAQLRAYIYGEVDTFVNFSLTEPILVNLVWKNTGVTPAKEFQTCGAVFFGPIPMADDPTLNKQSHVEGQKHSKSTVFPNAKTASSVDSRGQKTPEEIEVLVRAKKFTLFVFAEATYLDIFDREHVTQFCQFINPDDAIKAMDGLKGIPVDLSQVRLVWAHTLNRFT